MNKLITSLMILMLTTGGATIGHASNSQQTKDYLWNERFTDSSAGTGINYVRGYLKSFESLTKLTNSQLSPEQRGQVGNLGWETQSLGFNNWVNTIEGTMKKQACVIAKLEYDLAVEKFNSGKISQEDVLKYKNEYLKLKEDMDNYLNEFQISD